MIVVVYSGMRALEGSTKAYLFTWSTSLQIYASCLWSM